MNPNHTNRINMTSRLLGIAGALLCLVLTSTVARAVIIEAVSSNVAPAGSFPFGNSTSFYNHLTFVYKNIDPFSANANDILYFDIQAPSTNIFDFDIYFGATKSNGGTELNDDGFTKVVNRGIGDNIVGDFNLGFTLDNAFDFASGGFAIQLFGNHSFGGLSTQNLVGCLSSCGTDASGKFVSRFWKGDVGMINGFTDTNSIGNFRLETAAIVPTPATIWLFASGLIGLMVVTRRKKIV